MIGSWDIAVTAYNQQGQAVGNYTGVWWAENLEQQNIIFEDAYMHKENEQVEANMPAIRSYIPALNGWRSRHVFPLAGSDNSACENISTWLNDHMQLLGTCYKSDGSIKSYAKIRFFNIKTNSFDYTWESSKDGVNWTKYALIQAKRRSADNAIPSYEQLDYVDDYPNQLTQYDFLVGKWQVTATIPGDKSTYKGQWTAKPLHQGRVLKDAIVWQNAPLNNNYSLRTFSTKLNKWSISSISSKQDPGLCVRTSQMNSKQMHVFIKCFNKQGKITKELKETFSQITQQSFNFTRQQLLNEQWQRLLTIHASRI